MSRRHVRTGAAAAAVLLAVLSVLVSSAVPAASVTPSRVGYVRLAHLSPDTPQVDVWLTSFSDRSFSKVFPGVGYGVLSPYQRLVEGTYSVSMRPPGAAKSTPPILSTNITVEAGKAYTVAGVGPNKSIKLRVLADDLRRPAAGMARMRVVQASSVAPVVDVKAVGGATIASGARFPSTTPYAQVRAKRWAVEVQPRATAIASVQQSVNVRAGSIYTLLVLDRKSSAKAVQLVVRADAASATGVPLGGVNTGLGGGAQHPDPMGRVAGLAVLGLGLLVVVGVARRAATAR